MVFVYRIYWPKLDSICVYRLVSDGMVIRQIGLLNVKLWLIDLELSMKTVLVFSQSHLSHLVAAAPLKTTTVSYRLVENTYDTVANAEVRTSINSQRNK